MPLPAITLTDIGKKSKGVTYAELWQQVFDAVFKAFGKGGDGLKALGGILGDGAGSVTDEIGNAVDAVGNSVKGADKAVNAFKGLFK
jgi:phage-related protein